MGPRHHLPFCACNTAWLKPEILVSIGPRPYLWFLYAKQRLLEQNYKSLWVQDLTCRFVLGKQRDWNQNYWSLWVPALICGTTNLYGCQTAPVVLCMQYRVISSRITTLYESQASFVVFAFKITTFGAELQVSVGPRPHLSFCACKTACLASELLVSMGSSSHQWLLDAKQRLLDQNYKSLWVPDLTCRCVQAKQRD